VDIQHAALDAALLSSLAACSQLTSLRAAYAGLEELPACFGQLAALQHLDLTGNALRQLPSAVGQLSALTRLALGRNRLAELPPHISGLISLQVHL
jgi:Leucine-rich repeat (LRR) protein